MGVAPRLRANRGVLRLTDRFEEFEPEVDRAALSASFPDAHHAATHDDDRLKDAVLSWNYSRVMRERRCLFPISVTEKVFVKGGQKLR